MKTIGSQGDQIRSHYVSLGTSDRLSHQYSLDVNPKMKQNQRSHNSRDQKVDMYKSKCDWNTQKVALSLMRN